MPSSILHPPSSPRWFFEEEPAVHRLRTAAAEWRRTPFRFGSRAKGPTGGTDCVGFCEAVMKEAGVVESFNFPRTPADNSRHVHNDKILNYLRGKIDDPQSTKLAAIFQELDVERWTLDVGRFPLMPGDILLLKTGRGLWHMCVMLDDHAFMQCAFPDGVTEGDITAPNYREHLVTAFRARSSPSSILHPRSSP